ncbi:MAG: hypothetical protein M3Y89_18205, partial [Actinomycetota bacterium]|nr:hypothetical protein [Actinomycetota bacterium]
MRLTSRLVGLSATGLLLLGATVTLAAPASAIQPVTISGSAPATAHGPGTVAFTYTVNLPAAVDSTVLTTHQAAELPASLTGVTLDGVAVPAGQLSRPNSVDLAIQTGAAPTDGLAAGTHTITFLATLGSGASADTNSTATLSWTEAGVPASITSAAVPVAVNQPDLSVVLTPGTGEDQVGLLGTGRDLDLLVDVTNQGYGTPASTLTITLPTGMKLGLGGVSRDSDGSSVNCTPDLVNPQLIRCALGALAHDTGNDSTFDLDLTTTPAQTIGQVASVTISAAPDAGQGTDTNPANDSAVAKIQFTGSAQLSYTITPAKTKVVIGSKTTVTVTVHNAGPQAAPQTVALTVLVGNNFSIEGFTGKNVRLGAPGGPPAVGPGDGDGLLWLVGNIAPGQSVSATLTIQARKLGSAKISILAFSGAADPNCQDFTCTPTMVSVQAVTAPVVVAAPASGPALPATGSASEPALGLGGGLLLAGAGLL